MFCHRPQFYIATRSQFLIALLVGLLACGPTSALAQEQLICCGASEVFILRIEEDSTVSEKPVWSWRAEDSSQIPAGSRKTFASTDECKPVGEFILITSSSGGVALIRRSDKQCHFYTQAKNAHSACLLPNNQVAVASSFGGDELLIYNRDQAIRDAATPIVKIPLKGAHGTVWDKQLERLWALGTDELLLVKIQSSDADTKLIVERRLELPTPGGHELSQSRDESILFVTTDKHAYRFNKNDGSFTAMPILGNLPKLKSVTEHSVTGEVVYHQGSPENWWSDTIRFVGDRQSIRLSGQRLYKVRWDQ